MTRESVEELEREMLSARRDEQALWNYQKNLEIILVVQRVAAWYGGERNAALPEIFLSEVCRPGGDGDKNGTHRLCSLARATQQRMSLETDAFVKFKKSSYRVLDELESVRRLSAIAEARLQLNEFFAYLERKRRSNEIDAGFEKVLMDKVLAYKVVCEQIAGGFRQLELELLGEGAADVDVARIERKVDAIGANVVGLTRRLRQPVADMRQRRWVVAQVAYYMAHPEACLGDVSRRRVYVRDVWASVQAAAIGEHHIPGCRAFKRIYDSAMRTKRRSKVE